MYHMKTATVRDLRNHFRQVSKWIDRGETVEILKRGKPYAQLTRVASAKSFFGAGAGTMTLPPDIDEPLDIEWEAMK